MRDDAGQGGPIPADLEKDATEAASSAASTPAGSYRKTVNLPVVIGKTYKFWFTYLYEDPETKKISESNNSPVFTTTFQIPNETKPVLNLILTPGIKSYGVKFDVDPTSVQTDIIIYESLTGAFAGEEYIVYVGTSTNVSIHTDSFAPRWVKVTVRDNWLDANRSSVIAGPVSILANDPDTSTAPSAPSGVSVNGSIDPDDKSGFSGQIDASWTINSDTNTSGYVIRWSTQNPVTTQNPIWEYGQVDGRETTRFSVTGLVPNTLYYYQVTAKSPYNALSWASPSSGTFGPIVDANAPADAFAQLRSILSIGGKTADLFKIGTGITQSVNTSTTITPSQTSGTYSGIILNKSTTNFGHNYWLNTGQFRVGSSSAFLFWDGSDLYTTGKINATGGSFTGDVRLNGGTLYTGPTPLSGARVRFNSDGIFGYNATSTSNTTGQTFALTASDGLIDAREGFIGGWEIKGTSKTVGTISKNGTSFGSDGSIVLGDTTGTLASIVKLSSTDPTYRIWVGSQTSSNAKFRVGTDGTLYATGAVISASSGGLYDSIVAAQSAANAAQASATAADGKATTATTNATSALTTANGKNSIFRTGSTPTALKAGDIWVNSNDGNKLYVASAAGSGSWVLSQDASIALSVTKADDALTKATAAVTTANAAYPASNFSKSAILQAINASTNGATLSGGVLETGTVLADNVVSTYVYAGFISADKINAGILTGRDIDIANDSSTNRFRTSYNRNTPVSGTTVSALGINSIAMISASTSGVVSHWYPYLDAESDIGTTTYKWRTIRSNNGVIQTSDIRKKTNISDSDLGLNFINLLRPVKYNNKYDPKIPEVDETNQPILDEDGNRVIKSGQGYTGSRYHYGLIAQEVKSTLDDIGIGDTFSGWTLDNLEDPDSYQGLSYDKFIAPMIKSIQELSNMVELLQQEVNTLKGI
jgi:hypothetical protein